MFPLNQHYSGSGGCGANERDKIRSLRKNIATQNVVSACADVGLCV